MQELITKLGLDSRQILNELYNNHYRYVHGEKENIIDGCEGSIRFYNDINGHYTESCYATDTDECNRMKYIDMKEFDFGVLFPYNGRLYLVQHGSNVAISNTDEILSNIPEIIIYETICSLLYPLRDYLSSDSILPIFFEDFSVSQPLILSRENVLRYSDKFLSNLGGIIISENAPSDEILKGVQNLLDRKTIDCNVEQYIQVIDIYLKIAKVLISNM